MTLSTSPIPDNFPRGGPVGAVAGVQPKLLARYIDGQYVVGWTDDELRLRHEYCEDLVQQLMLYCARKERENPDWSHDFNLERMAQGVAKKARTGEWDIDADELAWMMARIRTLLGW
ncbi:MAG: hypothetical protein WBK19_05855 [Azonexus sp.]